jgi:hypothetical protein
MTFAKEHYRGLDSDRDTEAEVAAIVGFFPKVLSRQKVIYDNEEDLDGGIYYPIQLLAYTLHEGDRPFDRSAFLPTEWWCNAKAVSFIPSLARLATELGLFGEQYIGGLLIGNTMNILMINIYKF